MYRRIEYLDALRGLAMFLVVFLHVEGFCLYDFSYMSPLGSVLSLVHLPLFFFISGYLAYNASIPTWRRLKDKFIILVCPAVLVGLVYTFLILNKDFGFFINDTAKAGYWFTWVLFQMYAVYYLIRYLLRNSIARGKNEWLYILGAIAVMLFLGKYPMRMIPVLDHIGNMLSLHYTFTYFQFFVLGLFICHFQNNFSFLLEKGWLQKSFRTFIFILFLAGAFYKYYLLNASTSIGPSGKVSGKLLEVICGYLGTVCMFAFFTVHKQIFSKKTRLGYALQYIGIRTLEIYVLHYFFLIPLNSVVSLELVKQNFAVEVILAGSLTAAVICLVILTAWPIRKNRILAKYLLGIR